MTREEINNQLDLIHNKLIEIRKSIYEIRIVDDDEAKISELTDPIFNINKTLISIHQARFGRR